MDVQRLIEYIVARLAADSTLMALGLTGVYDTVADNAAQFPFILVYDTGNSAIRGPGGLHVMTNALVGVRVVAQTESATSILAAAERIDELLQGTSTSSTGLEVVDIARDSELKRNYSIDGESYRELGGLYRCFGRKAS